MTMKERYNLRLVAIRLRRLRRKLRLRLKQLKKGGDHK